MGAVVLFDGICNFCNGAINFVIRQDTAGYFKFAPLQSEIGEKMRSEFAIDASTTDSMIVVENGKAHTHSTAGLRIARGLGLPWNLLYALVIVPKPIRD